MSGWTGAGRVPSGGETGNRLPSGSLKLAWIVGGALAATPVWAQSALPDDAVTPAAYAAPLSGAAAQGAAVLPGTGPAGTVQGGALQLVTQPPVIAAQPLTEQTTPSTGTTATDSSAGPRGTAHHDSRHGAEEETGIVVSSRPLAPDPGKAINQASFAATQAVDSAVIEPLSKGYEAIVPSPVRDGLHNAIYNLREPVIAANFLLQHKIGKTGETLARFVINSTVGLAGIFDMAKRKPFRLRFRDNGFADTLGFYGVGNGPYIYLPLFGSTTLRDLTGRMVDRAALPLAIGGQVLPTAAVVPMIMIGILDRRLVNKERLRQEREAADPYSTTRDNYLRRRADEIEGLRHPNGASPPEEKEEG